LETSPILTNLVYGTARVVRALTAAFARGLGSARQPLESGLVWLLDHQNADGSWGADGTGTGTVEETALAIESLADVCGIMKPDRLSQLTPALGRGVAWLVERVEAGTWQEAAPIGFYFAKLWYYERLYPIIFTVAALMRVSDLLSSPGSKSSRIET